MRSGQEYDEIVKDIVQIYIDYNIKSFPIDLEKVCRQLGVTLTYYSVLGSQAKDLLIKKSPKGFFVRGTHENNPTIYINDYDIAAGEKRYTISHEIKHYVDDECSSNGDYDDLADYFARFFLCPIPYLMVMDLVDPNDIKAHCNVTISAASHAASNITNRRSKYGHQIFDHEIPLISHLVPEEYELYKKKYYDESTGRWLN